MFFVERSIEVWCLIGGSFDLIVFGVVFCVGYDCSFEQLGARDGVFVSELFFGCIDIIVVDCIVQLFVGFGFDVRGIGKGFVVDIVVFEMVYVGVDGVCVNLGGDLRVLGIGFGGVVWMISFEHF